MTPSAKQTPGTSQPIRAQISTDALLNVTRMFNGTVQDIANELLQNARRAGAGTVDITTESIADATGITITDNGTGLADMATLLSFGETAWPSTIRDAECPAGMGLLSLAKYGCTIRWRTRGLSEDAEPAAGYTLHLRPGHFTGEEEAAAVGDETAPLPHGTQVTFRVNESTASIEASFKNAVLHFPIPVSLNGETLERRSILDGALHTESWEGLRFGVHSDFHGARLPGDLNFHGLTLGVRLPWVAAVDNVAWGVRADIDTCPDLQLVLPSRKEAVETPFLTKMREAARLAIYRGIAATEDAPCLAWADREAANTAGIHIPMPAPQLLPWRPTIADGDRWQDSPSFTDIPMNASRAVADQPLIVTADLGAPRSQMLYRALLHAGLEKQIFQAQPQYAGYPWYDRLAKLHDIHISLCVGAKTYSLEDFPAPTKPDEQPRPDSIRIDLEIKQDPDESSSSPGCRETLSITTDVAFLGDDGDILEDACPLVTEGSGITPYELATLLVDSFFWPSDDAAADSYETQRSYSDAAALHMAMKLLSGDDEARKRSIADAVWREILWLFPCDHDINIEVRGANIEVIFKPRSS